MFKFAGDNLERDLQFFTQLENFKKGLGTGLYVAEYTSPLGGLVGDSHLQ